MKQVKILSEGIRAPDEKQVMALLYDDVLPETRQLVTIMQLGFDARDHIAANFDALWVDALFVTDGWAIQIEREDIQQRAALAITLINNNLLELAADIILLPGADNPTTKAILGRVLDREQDTLTLLRKLIRYLTTA